MLFRSIRLEYTGSGPAESGPGPEAQLVSRQLGERLDAAIAALPASQRAALLLCQVQGFSNQQAADIVGVSVRSLESLVARARRSLRQSLSDPPTGDPPTGDRKSVV